jgi:hypothetical protein
MKGNGVAIQQQGAPLAVHAEAAERKGFSDILHENYPERWTAEFASAPFRPPQQRYVITITTEKSLEPVLTILTTSVLARENLQ